MNDCKEQDCQYIEICNPKIALKNKNDMYENCIADLVGELQKYSYSNYFRSKSENEIINYFKNKWGIK